MAELLIDLIAIVIIVPIVFRLAYYGADHMERLETQEHLRRVDHAIENNNIRYID